MVIHNSLPKSTMEDDEKVSFCERILSDLDNIFKRDANILEFDIIESVDSICNKSPVIYVDHNLALEKWCIPHLYDYANKKIVAFKNNSQRSDLYMIHQLTRIMLFINPDLTTAWNLRRVVINNNVQTHLDDLKLTELVLLRKPKCASLFNYREWLLNSLFQINKTISFQLVDHELVVTLNAASRYARNYYAWSHRAWIFTFYLTNTNNSQYINKKIIEDLQITESWIESHVSDYSCFQHRQFLFGTLFGYGMIPSISAIISEQSKIEILLNEFKFLNSLFRLYPEQESLFLHRRALLHSALRWCPDKLELLRQSEIEFYKKHICPNFIESPVQRIKSWSDEIQQRYLAYLKRNLNWTFDN